MSHLDLLIASLNPEARKIMQRVGVLIEKEFPDVKPSDLRDAFSGMATVAQDMLDEETHEPVLRMIMTRKIIKPLEKPNMCRFLEPDIHGGIVIAWWCENLDVKGGLCPHIGDEAIWCPLRAHGVTSQTVEDDNTIWEVEG